MDIRQKIEAAVVGGLPLALGGPADPASFPDADWDDRTVDGRFLVDLFVGNGVPVHPAGIRIAGIRIVGELDFSHMQAVSRIALLDCWLDVPFVDGIGAEVPGLMLSRCRMAALHLDGARLSALDISGSRIDGRLSAIAADLGSLFNASGTYIVGEDDRALSLDGSRLAGAFHVEDAVVEGTVSMVAARVGGPVTFCGSTVRAGPDLPALLLDGLTVDNSVFLTAGFSADGGVRARGITVRNEFFCDGARLVGSPDALDLAGSVIDAVGLGDGFESSGTVTLNGARLGVLNCTGTFDGGDGAALTLDGADVRFAVRLEEDVDVKGTVRLVNAVVSGVVGVQGRLRAGGAAFLADGARIGSLRFDGPFEVAGTVSLVGVQCTGQVVFHSGTVAVDGGVALALDGMSVGTDVALSEVSVIGRVDGVRLACQGGLVFDSCTLTAWAGTAVRLDGARVAGDLFLDSTAMDGAMIASDADLTALLVYDCTVGTDADGRSLVARRTMTRSGTYLARATFAGEVQLTDGTIGAALRFQTGAAEAVDLTGTTVEGVLAWGTFGVRRQLVLTGATVRELADTPPTWPPSVLLDRFTYESLRHADEETWRERTAWLARQPEYRARPYLQLAAYYQRAGRTRDARKVQIERHKALMRSTRYGRFHLWRQLVRFTIGFGYEPWRALAVLAVVFVVGCLVYSSAESTMRRTGQGDAREFNAVVYSLDTLLPIIDFGEAGRWVPAGDRGAGWFRWGSIAVGWLLASLVVVGFTNAVKRE